MFRAIKDAAWWVLAKGLSRAAEVIRRKPCGRSPQAWRAVEFSYSQFGEDIVVLSLLRAIPPELRGRYVDVGAFDPILHSNTYLLYVNGWRGLNIDASAKRMATFAGARPGDTNIVTPVSDTSADVLFLEYPTPGTSRVIPASESDRTNALNEDPVSATSCQTETLTALLDRHCPTATIDFINIDCEGLDLAVLRGLDWSRWTPRVIAVEANTPADRARIIEYLSGKGYLMVSQHLVTLILLHESAWNTLPLGLMQGFPEAASQ